MCIYVCVHIFINNIKIFFETGTLFSLGWPRTDTYTHTHIKSKYLTTKIIYKSL